MSDISPQDSTNAVIPTKPVQWGQYQQSTSDSEVRSSMTFSAKQQQQQNQGFTEFYLSALYDWLQCFQLCCLLSSFRVIAVRAF